MTGICRRDAASTAAGLRVRGTRRTVSPRRVSCAVPVLLLAVFAPTARAQVAADLGAFERRVARAVDAVAPSVVALSIARAPEPEPAGPLLRLPARPEQWLAVNLYRRPARILASGVIVTEEGHILTSYSPLRRDIRRMAVRRADGREIAAELVGFDQRRDVALLRADLPETAVPEFASDPPRVGDWVVAVGRVPDPSRPTATVGIVSARRRMQGAALQVDAELNYGNVGGALVDLDGRMLGIACNVGEHSQWGQNSGVGFALAWDKLETLLPRLRDGLRAVAPTRPSIGVSSSEGALDVEGALIDAVEPGGPADRAGLKEGDLVKQVDAQPLRRWEDLVEAVGKRKVGDAIVLSVERTGEVKRFTVQVGAGVEE